MAGVTALKSKLEELMLWEAVTQRTRSRDFSGCPIPALYFGAQCPCSPWSTAQPHGEAASSGEVCELWAPFPLHHGGFPCWTSFFLHVQWELGADLEQLSWSLLEPYPRHCQGFFHPLLLCFFQLL